MPRLEGRLLFAGLAGGLVLAAGLPARAQTGGRPVSAEGLPLSFEKNVGQVDGRVRYLSRSREGLLFLTREEAVLVLDGAGAARKPAVLRMALAGARAVEPEGREPLSARSHYYLGSDPRRWHLDVPQHGRVAYAGVYPGVSLVFYGRERRLAYDFVVSPGADPRVIRLRFEGASRLHLDPHGNLVLGTPAGEVLQEAPRLYQERGDLRRSVSGRFVLEGEQVRFEVGPYDRSRPLVIDPGLVYSSYMGGAGDDYGQAIAIDASGNVYVTGGTASANFPTAGSASQGANAGGYDAFVARFGPGPSLVWSTYLGGGGTDFGNAIAVDASGNVYVTGGTDSADFPTAGSPSQGAFAGVVDGFVTKLDPASALVYSTYLGGSASEVGTGLAVDESGKAYVAGTTSSSDFPTAGAPSQGAKAGLADAFVTKLGPTSALSYSTFLGGSADDYGNALARHGSGDVYVTGETSSTDFPTAGTPSQATKSGGADAFVTRLGPASARVYSTFLGGSAYDTGFGIAVDGSGNAYVAGQSGSADFPTAGAPSQPALGGALDAFVARLDPASARSYATYLGGSANESALNVDVDVLGNAYVAGATLSADFPTAGSPFQGALAGLSDAFVARLDPGSARTYSSYLGGAGADIAYGVRTDGSGNAYLLGHTSSANFPTAGAPLQPAFGGGGRDAFLARVFEPTPGLSFFTVSPCRLLDTRDLGAPVGGPVLAAGVDRTVPMTGHCGLPAGAKAVSLNVTVTQPSTAGNLRLYPAGGLLPLISTVNYSAGRTRGNNGIIRLSGAGQLAIRCAQASGTAHAVIDVNGYFQ